MYPQEFIVNLSLLLSEILNRIGASPFIRKLRRYYCNQEEWLNCMIFRDADVELFVFGSRTEGTTTEGMGSDHDVLECYDTIRLIQSRSDAVGDTFTFYGYIFDDEKTHPGYVKLQLYAHDMPLALCHLEFLEGTMVGRDIVVENEKLLLRNRFGRLKYTCDETNGPARTDVISTSRYHTTVDRIFALKCKTWPRQARGWFQREARRYWPSTRVQRLLRRFGCFITPVGYADSECKTVEWRLSLSEAERVLIWSLNDTQFKCIVLMKLLTKQFIKPVFPDCVTSYHCKNVVFWVIETTRMDLWQPKNTAVCIHLCLLKLLQFVERLNIPQYFIPENNLLRHKLNRINKTTVAEIIRNMIRNKDYKFFLCVEIDNVGDMIHNCFSGFGHIQVRTKQKQVKTLICRLALPIIGQFSYWRIQLLTEKLTEQNVSNEQTKISSAIKKHFKLLSELQKSVIEYRNLRTVSAKSAATLMDMMTSHVCVSLGHNLLSFAASVNLFNTEQRETLYKMAFQYIREGSRHDNVTNNLKCAHVLYRCRLFNEALTRLKEIEEKLIDPVKQSLIPICSCWDTNQVVQDGDIKVLSTHSLDSLIGDVAAYCVLYLRTEMALTPTALVYEMFRSTGHKDDEIRYQWMQHAVVDSTILLFYLQFLCFRALGDVVNQEKYLLNILDAISRDENLGHVESALNILGHCFIEQGFFEAAFDCFVRSLRYSVDYNPDKFPTNEARRYIKQLHNHNAAKWHLCVCLFKIIQQHKNKVKC